MATAYRSLELTLISAKDLKNVNFFSKMDVYAVVSHTADPGSKQRTPADRDGGRNPNWNFTIRTVVPATHPGPGHGHIIHILLRSHRILGDRDVGEVRVPLRELLDPSPGTGSGGPGCPKFLSYQVRRISSGKAKGVLTFSYKLGEAVTAPVSATNHYNLNHPATDIDRSLPVDTVTAYPAVYPPPEMAAKGMEPVTAYPAYPPPYPYGAPPPPQGYPMYGYGSMPQPGYGYPAGYGYGQQPAQRKNNFGMGLGAGILGGAVGGMLIGDMISDSAAFGAYDAGYSAGFDDAGGIGF